MLKRGWIIVAALGLGLALGEVGYSQEAKTPDAQGQTDTQQEPAYPLPLPLRVDIIEDQAEAEARQRSEESAAQRELDDLAAQEGMNESTERMADYAVYQTILIGIGTAALLYTLYLTRQANRAAQAGAAAAQAAVNETRRIGEAQVRSYLQFTAYNLNYVSDADALIVTGALRNKGQSPALKVMIGGLLSSKEPVTNAVGIDPLVPMSPSISYMAPAGEIERCDVALPFANFVADFDPAAELWCTVFVSYLDVFKVEQTAYFRGKLVDAYLSPVSKNTLAQAALTGHLLWANR